MVSHFDQDIDRYITAHAGGDFGEVLQTDDHWEVFYHLADIRTGLLGWYPVPRDAEILEIGGGFGALTGALCAKEAHVTVLERSLFRARSLFKRWDTCGNLDIYVGKLEDMPFHRQFDIITLVDGLSRVAGGSTDLTPYANYLNRLGQLLMPHGKLLIALDNRLGLKFFCGACDPFSQEPFGQLSGDVGDGRLFTRAELRSMLAEAGFSQAKFYYPLPDFRLPRFLFTDAHQPSLDIGEQIIPYDVTSDTRVLAETQLYRDIIEGGLFPQMANSFLIEASCYEGDACPVDFVSLAADREPAYNLATCVQDGETVVKRPLTAAGRQGLRALADNMTALAARGLTTVPLELSEGEARMPYWKGPTLTEWLRERGPEDREQVLAALDRLWAAILQSSPPAPDSDNFLRRRGQNVDWGVVLRRAYLNMTPDNIFYTDGQLVFFNQCLTRENCPAKFPMFLAVYESAGELGRILSLDDLKSRFGLVSLWDAMVEEQQRFVAESQRYDDYRQIYEWARMDPRRLLKNRQILKIIGNET